MGRALMVILLGALSTFAVVNFNINSILDDSMETVIDYYSDNQARNIANSMIQLILTELGDDNNYRVNTAQTKNLFEGSVSYTATDTTISGSSYIKISSTGTYNNISRTSSVLAFIPTSGFVPNTTKAAITSNYEVEITGRIVIDGRQHDKNGNLIASSGTNGIWTTQGLWQRGASTVGGTSSGTDYAPSRSPDPSIIKTGQTYPGGFPSTPDSVLGGVSAGFPPGALKSIAQAGTGGSQYTTNPGSLSYPLIGVTYVELPPGGEWNPSNIDGSGVLIIHNNTNDAALKNMNWGTFKGLIISDKLLHVHSNVIGGIVILSNSAAHGRNLGNGNGQVLYSAEAIEEATGAISSTSSPTYGFAKARVEVAEWNE